VDGSDVLSWLVSWWWLLPLFGVGCALYLVSSDAYDRGYRNGYVEGVTAMADEWKAAVLRNPERHQGVDIDETERRTRG
jgi:hypothetical protein